MGQDLTTPRVDLTTPRNIYGQKSSRESADSYGFPQSHSPHSSISSASAYPSYYSSSLDNSSVSDYGSQSDSVEPINSRTLPPPTGLINATLPPAPPSSMMGQFNSKISSSTQKKHKCKICDKRFTRPSSLQTHMYSHTGEKRKSVLSSLYGLSADQAVQHTRVKPKAVVGISQSFQISDVIARYTGVINRQIKTHQRDHGCLKRRRQIIKEQISVPHHYYFHGATFLSWHQEYKLSLLLHRCAMYCVYVMSHLYGHVRRPCPSPVILLSNYYPLRHCLRSEALAGLSSFSTVLLDIPTLAIRRLTFRLWRNWVVGVQFLCS